MRVINSLFDSLLLIVLKSTIHLTYIDFFPLIKLTNGFR
ncbi:hypothetical protein CNEO4_1760036 [Clostridium neonatale]|nr:hypothetical protein CNEO2_100031 [Clostridium neonatale]CAI3535650.1 hypothetical protein CNEO4_100048 [Clostridium neonatale]CAI3538880.1 hypothetical protein CNEO4_150048 [Clostridium neonatale]CAI3549900.1 hypothetical protein CNEO4_1470045 [Clostridium neonatale]CAI3572824.1 hypothetical protein CNEO3_120048 [Clostridium neonatale]